MSYVYLNLNPLRRNTNDCVIRAIALAMNMSWDDVYMDVARMGKDLADNMEANSTWGTYLKRNGWIQEVLPDHCPECYTVQDFCRDFPSGTYIVATGSHVLCIKDGAAYDTSDPKDEILTYYFRKK